MSEVDSVQNRYQILVCIDGGDESFRGLHYAVRFSADHDDTDITLLYIRPIDRSSAAGGLTMARENLLDWGIELPGTKSLKRARDYLLELGALGENWKEERIEKKGRGDRLGDFMIEYISPAGKCIRLLLRVSTSVLSGILDEAQGQLYDLVIVAGSENADIFHAGHIDMRTAIAVATEHTGTVILARELEEGHGHLVCVSSPDNAAELARREAAIAGRCGCPIHLYGVGAQGENEGVVREALQLAEKALESAGYAASSVDFELGDPVELICKRGKQHSIIALATTEKSRLNRWFLGSISRKVLAKASNSVMIVR